jgi:6-phosphogluconate dehydrogenase
MTHLWLIGLGTMGENLVRNIISRDESIVVWNRSLDKVDALVAEIGDTVTKAETIADLIGKTESPRNIILLVPAGKVTTEVAQELFGILSPGDAIWDLGNAHWDVTLANQTEALKHGIHWVGCGISGGSEGARLWPALMPGGEEETVRRMLPLLEKIAAKDFGGKPCVTYVGRAAAGNFVKMVHNGIEYAIMQWIAEIYDILRSANTPQAEMKTIFEELNTGLLKSFLLDITVDILGTKDSDGTDLLEKISDIAGSKWTGGWTVEAALKLGVPVPTIAESLFARWLSGRNHHVSFWKMKNEWISKIETHLLKQALKVAYISAYVQGIELILAAEKEWSWGIDIHEVLRIWQGGCIIRSEMLRVLPDFYTNSSNSQQSEDIPALLLGAKTVLNQVNMSTPVLSSAYNYITTLLAEKLPTNLIQAMRDSFWAHGVKRIGSDVSESFTWK